MAVVSAEQPNVQLEVGLHVVASMVDHSDSLLVVQLETIYVLEGLGPPKEHAPGSKSFKDQVSLP